MWAKTLGATFRPPQIKIVYMEERIYCILTYLRISHWHRLTEGLINNLKCPSVGLHIYDRMIGLHVWRNILLSLLAEILAKPSTMFYFKTPVVSYCPFALVNCHMNFKWGGGILYLANGNTVCIKKGRSEKLGGVGGEVT